MALAACGTLSSTSELVNISSPDDPLVVKIDGSSAVTSPDFARIRRHRTHEVTLLSPKSRRILTKQTVTCDPRWITSGLCHAVLAVLGNPLLGLAGLGIDLATGAAFDCNGALLNRISIPHGGPDKPPLCPRYLVAPPGHADIAVSQRLTAIWQRAKRREVGFCGEFVAPRVSERVFDYLNISNLNAATFDHLTRSQANILGYEAKADQLVVLSDQLDHVPPELEAEVIDLHTLKRRRDRPVELPPAQAKELVKEERPRWLMYSFSLIPNTIMYGVTQTARTLATADRSDHILSAEEHGSVPTAISSLAVGSLDHPMGFDEWDISLSFYPSLDINLWNVRARTTLDPSNERKFQTFFINLPYNAELSFFTPAGTFGLAASAGPMPTWVFGKHKTVEVLFTTTGELSWTAFTSRDFFLQAAYDYRQTSRPIENSGIACRQWNEVSLHVGYFTDVFHRISRALLSSQVQAE